MGSLQGPVICPAFRAKQTGVYTLSVSGPLMKAKFLRSGFWGFNGIMGARINVSHQLHVQRCKKVHCSFSSSSNGNGSMAENFNENDEDYVNSSVVEALEVKSGPDGFMIKMRDGRHLRCVHNNPQGGHLPDYAPHPAIVLKMEDGTGLLLPIIVLEMPSVLLMAAIRNVQIVKVVRVTKRVHEAYFAQLYLTKLCNETESVGFDLRPSDAINIAVYARLLAREGINAEQCARDLKSFELKMAFEDVFPAEATIVEEYLQQIHAHAESANRSDSSLRSATVADLRAARIRNPDCSASLSTFSSLSHSSSSLRVSFKFRVSCCILESPVTVVNGNIDQRVPDRDEIRLGLPSKSRLSIIVQAGEYSAVRGCDSSEKRES